MTGSRDIQSLVALAGTLALCFVLSSATPAQAATNTFETVGAWSTPGNWNLSHVPTNGEHVVIDANVTNSSGTASLASYTLNAGKTHTFQGWDSALTATVVTVNGTMTHKPQTATSTNGAGLWIPDSRVYVVCSNFTLAASRLINVNSKGYQGYTNGPGYGPGGGAGTKAGVRGGGGGYGGEGGESSRDYAGGVVYGSSNAPVDPGSAGGAGWGFAPGSAGGGAVRIVASGTVTIDGTINANSANQSYGGTGSGGGVYITCNVFAGSGAINATAGTGANSGGGGGGRIAVVYNPASQAAAPKPGISFSARYGNGENAKGVYSMPGTLYFPDTTFFPYETLTGTYRLIIPGFTNWAPNTLTINNGWLQLPDDRLFLSVTNDVLLSGASSRLNLTNGILDCGGTLTIEGQLLLTNLVLNSGDLIVTNGGDLFIYSGMTNASTPDHGAVLDVVNHDIRVYPTSRIYPYSHPTNGGSVLIKAKNMFIASSAQINANGRGYIAARGQNSNDGYGSGGGSGTGGSRAGGGGYGGAGGDSQFGHAGGGTYGSSNAPIDPGSAGGCGTGSTGGGGGGSIRIDVGDHMTVNGSLLANGGSSMGGAYSGGGSGGGIYLTCAWFLGNGNGLLAANGGGGDSAGGGGGGRIAIWRKYGDLVVTNEILGGVPGDSSDEGAPGTFVWGQLPAEPVVSNSAPTSVSTVSATLNGFLVYTGTAPSKVFVYWDETDHGTNKTLWAHTNAFAGWQSPGATFATNVTGLTPGTTHYYRFNGSNSVGESWADPVASFNTQPGNPTISNNAEGAAPVTLTSASLNGTLMSTGVAFSVVSVFWGTSDGGTNWGAWQNTNSFPGFQNEGGLSTNVTLSTSNVTYYYTYFASNTYGIAWARPSKSFAPSPVWIDATDSAAIEKGGSKTGEFALYRLNAVTNEDVTINYGMSGTASNGVDYVLLPGTVLIPAGSTNVTVTLTPYMDDVFDDSETVIMTILDGSYAIGSPSSDTVTITDVTPSLTNTWTGSGVWTNLSNWSEQAEPFSNQHAVIDGNVTLNKATERMATLTLNGGRQLTFSSTNAILDADEITINGTVTHAAESTTTTNGAGKWVADNRVYIVCSNLTLTAGKLIDVNGRGYQGNTVTNGYGPGGGKGAGVQRAGGGGYGGEGGDSSRGYAGGVTYGLAATPTEPGSAGGSGYGNSLGGHGGGAIRIIASGTVTVDGTIRANGLNGAGYAGAGSGGGVFITCNVFAGSGLVTTIGGNGSSGGGAGGGRIAVIYDAAAQAAASKPTVSFSAKYGTGENVQGADNMLGTVYFPDTAFFPYVTLSGGYRIVIPGFTDWSPDSLTIDNAWIQFPDGMTITATNDVVLSGSSSKVILTNGTFNCGGSLTIQGSLSVTNLVLTGGDLLVTNTGSLYVYSGATNGSSEHGAVINVGGNDIIVANGAKIYPISHSTNGGSVLFIAYNVIIESGGQINANGRGFRGAGAENNNNGLGRGGGIGTGGSRAGGGGYGGAGGASSHGWAGGPTYGSSNAPTLPGSAGGDGTGTALGSPGGGLVTIQAIRTVRVDGSISANGSAGIEYNGAGSGGAIYITCRIFEGSGTLYANGGNGASSGGGGGGRIAVWRGNTNTCATEVTGGTTSDGSDPGQPGTVVWGIIPAAGTVIVIR